MLSRTRFRKVSRDAMGWWHTYTPELDNRCAPGANVLDLGCGWRYPSHCSFLGAHAFVAGVDIDRDISRQPLPARVRADAHVLPFADNSFDLVSSVYVVEHLHDPSRCLSEVARVLRSGGVMMFLTNSCFSPAVWLAFALVLVLAGWRLYAGRSGSGHNHATDKEHAAVWQSAEEANAAGIAQRSLTPGRRAARASRRHVSDRRTVALLKSGKVRKLSGAEPLLGRDPQVVAEFYEDAPPEAVDRLKQILASGSNEDRTFTRAEQFSPEVIEKVRDLAPVIG